MKSKQFLLSLVLMTLCTVGFAQNHANMQKPPAPKSEAQISFDTMKTLAGTWEGRLTTVPLQAEVEGKYVLVSLRVTSLGNALLHEMKVEGRPDDPITMLYLDADRLLLTHYCDAGNRPRMAAKVSPDGKTVEFNFLDVVGSTRYGNMHDAEFTVIDANHHTEVWTWMGPDGKLVRVRFDLQRKN